ncbi:MAG TPA: oligopeptide/dipeptide ABC transporter ATP-binding protein [Actinomycetota bacterium]|nr:oligopeptide/dipeptide ABC transporter ATP-binding protein [Actinomycetota bacterium]
MTRAGGAPGDRPGGPSPLRDPDVVLDVRHLRKLYTVRRGFGSDGVLRAVDDVSFQVRRGETLALVGESGCGKTTTARCVVRAIEPTSGEIWFRTAAGRWIDIAHLRPHELRPLRREMQMVFQDPFSSLNPRMTVFDIVGEPLLLHGMRDRAARLERVAELLSLVGLRPEYLQRFPHAFSGGQRQRIGIARALALNPRLIVADEPVSALDVSVQAQIINLLLDLQERLDLAYLFVTHNLSIVRHISDVVAVMYVGQIVELGPRDQIFEAPRHPYTAELIAAVPKPDPRARSARDPLPGEVADPADPPPGCYFHPRCRFATDRCRVERPRWEEVSRGRFVRCHRARELELAGIRSA